MKQFLFASPLILSILASIVACDKSSLLINDIEPMPQDSSTTVVPNSNSLAISVGNQVFTATLLDNPTAKSFKALLPLTIEMIELNANEKYARLPSNLPIKPGVPASIQAGDLMMYGSNTLVLFYQSFSTSYSYTKLGTIDNITGLTAALGNGNVKVHFEIK